MEEFDPHVVLEQVYPVAKACVSPLVSIVQANPGLAAEVIELALMIGINQAMARIQWDKIDEAISKIKPSMYPRW